MRFNRSGLMTVSAALCLIGYGLWIPAKAELAQWLLKDAWQQTLISGIAQKPWQWADHWPVARLRVPAAGIDQIVLEGDSGAVLAFAPGHNRQSALPGENGTVIISGHRDTHFAFLKTVQKHQIMLLETTSGTQTYRIDELQVVDSRKTQINLTDTGNQLLLVTCYPFDSPVAGGPLRYVVTAEPLTPAETDTGLTMF